MFGQSFIAGQTVKHICKAFGCSDEDAKDIGKIVSVGVAVLTADLTGQILESATEGAMIEAGFVN